MLTQALAITGINIRSIPERWGSSLVIVIGLAGVVAVFTALLAMATALAWRRQHPESGGPGLGIARNSRPGTRRWCAGSIRMRTTRDPRC